MWRFRTKKQFPIRCKHEKIQRPTIERNRQLSSSSQEVPIVMLKEKRPKKILQKPEDLIPTTKNQEPSSLPVENPQTPVSVAPSVVTGLLQDVLSIMTAIIDQRTSVQGEDAVLRELTKLVIILQDEAETLANMADVVEEYMEEVEISDEVAGIEEWVSDLNLEKGIAIRNCKDNLRRIGHERDDSGIGLEEDEEARSAPMIQSTPKIGHKGFIAKRRSKTFESCIGS